jgi:branched-chain amino acid transport system permease protein
MFPQVITNALIAAAIYAAVGLSFAVIYFPARFFHFAHGATFLWGAYLYYAGRAVLALPFWVAALMAVAGSALLGIGMELCIYRPARRQGSTSTVLLLMSLGTYIVLQNLISLSFGDATRSVRGRQSVQSFVINDVHITEPQIWIVCSAVTMFAITWLMFRATRIGKSMRAVAADPELAIVRATNVDAVILTSFIFGSTLAGVAGILTSLDTDMTPTMGLNALMMGVVAVIVGGRGSIIGVVLGALLLGLAQHLGVWKIGTQWQEAIAFLILIAFLLFRPNGFFGTPLRNVKI